MTSWSLFTDNSNWESFDQMFNDMFNQTVNNVNNNKEVKDTSLLSNYIEVTPVRGYERFFVGTQSESKEMIQDGVKTNIAPIETKYFVTMDFIKEFPSYILAIVNPTKEMWDVAIKEDSSLCSYIGQPTKEQIISAVKQDIHFLKNLDKKLLTDEIMELAVIIDGHAIQYAPKQTKKLQELALKSNPLSIQFMKDATAEMKLQAVKANSRAIEFI